MRPLFALLFWRLEPFLWVVNSVLPAFLSLPLGHVLAASNMVINYDFAAMLPCADFVMSLTYPLHAPVKNFMAPLMAPMVLAPTGVSPYELPLFFCAGAYCGSWESPFEAPSIEYAAFKLFLGPLDSIFTP